MALYGLFTPVAMWIAAEVLTVVALGWNLGTVTSLFIDAVQTTRAANN